MSAMKTCFQIAECSFSSAKITYFSEKHVASIQNNTKIINFSLNTA